MTDAEPGAPRAEAHARRNVFLTYALAVGSTTANGVAEFAFPLNLDRLGQPLALVGAVVALIGLGSLLSRLPGGAWYSLQRARALTAGAFTVLGISSIGMGLVEEVWVLAVLALVNGISFGLASTFLLALLIEVRPRHERAAATMGWYTAAVSLGYALSAMIAGVLIERFGYSAAFGMAGAVALVSATVTLALRLPGHPIEPGRVSMATAGRARFTLRWQVIGHLPATVWLATLLVFYINFLATAYTTFYPIYAITIGISVGTIGVLRSLHALSATGIRFASPILFRYVNASVVNHVSLLGMALATVVLSVVTEEIVLLGLFVTLGIGRGLVRVTSATQVAEERGHLGSRVGLASGIYNAGLDAGTMLGPPVNGFLAQWTDIPSTMRVVAIVLPALYYAVWFAERARSRARAAAEAEQSPEDPRLAVRTE